VRETCTESMPIPIDEPCPWVDPPAVRRARRAERAALGPWEERTSLGLGSSLAGVTDRAHDLDPEETRRAWFEGKKKEKLNGKGEDDQRKH
jgi:hypothetical protein